MQTKILSIAAVIAAVSAAPQTTVSYTNVPVSNGITVNKVDAVMNGAQTGDLNQGTVAGAISGSADVNVYGTDVSIVGGANGRAAWDQNGLKAEGAVMAVVSSGACQVVVAADGRVQAEINPALVNMQGAASATGNCWGLDGTQTFSGTYSVNPQGFLTFTSGQQYCFNFNGSQKCVQVGGVSSSTYGSPSGSPSTGSGSRTPSTVTGQSTSSPSTNSAGMVSAGLFGTVAAIFALAI